MFLSRTLNLWILRCKVTGEKFSTVVMEALEESSRVVWIRELSNQAVQRWDLGYLLSLEASISETHSLGAPHFSQIKSLKYYIFFSNYFCLNSSWFLLLVTKNQYWYWLLYFRPTYKQTNHMQKYTDSWYI